MDYEYFRDYPALNSVWRYRPGEERGDCRNEDSNGWHRACTTRRSWDEEGFIPWPYESLPDWAKS